jgi:3-oxo-5-alpha-steroid 4-dehydrogenase 1
MKLNTPFAGLIAVSQTAILLVVFSNIIGTVGALEDAAYIHMAMALVTLLSVTLFHAPYGRYSADTIVPIVVDTRAAWILQEMPTLAAVGFHFARTGGASTVSLTDLAEDPCQVWSAVVNGIASTPSVAFIGLALFFVHYVHRTLIFPFMIQPRSPTPIHVMLLANAYCCFNGTLQASTWIRFAPTLFAKVTVSNLLADPCSPAAIVSAVGILLFISGMIINMKSDYALVALRRQTAAGSYSIPRGFAFEFISCPNFFGEGVEWLGYAITAAGLSGACICSTAGLVGASFFLYTLSNTFPRGVKHHQWYLNTFKEKYAQLNRKAVIPFLL